MKKAQEHEIALIITGDGKGGVKAVRANREEVDKLGQAQDKGRRKTDDYGKSHKKTSKEVDGFTKVVDKGAKVVAAAALAATAALTALFNSRARAVEATVNTAQMLGVSTEAFMGQAYAVSFLGIETQTYGDILRETTKRVQEFATKGTGTAADFFRTMNLDVQEFANLKPDEMMRRLGDELKGLNQNQRIMFLDMLGGSQAAMLGNVITQLSELEEEATAIGVALGDIDAQILADSVAGMTRMEAVATGAANQIALGLAPIVTDLTDRMYGAAVQAGGLGDTVDGMVDGIVTALGYPLNSFQRWRELLAMVRVGVLSVAEAITGALASSAETTATVFNTVLGTVADVLAYITDKWAGLIGVAGKVPGHVGQPFRDLEANLRGAAEGLRAFEITAGDVESGAEAMSVKLAAARAEYLQLVNEPPASEQLAQWLEDVRDRAEQMAAATVEANQSIEAGGPVFDQAHEKAEQLIRDMEFENSIMKKNSLERQIEINLRKLGADATDEQRAAVRRLTIERHAHEDAMKAEAEQAKLTGQILENQIENVQKGWGDLIYGMLDEGKLKWQNFFDFITDGWKRAYAEFASRNLTAAMFGSGEKSLAGLLKGEDGGFSLGSITSGLSGLFGLDKIPGLINGTTDFIGNLIGYQGTALAGPTANGSPLTAGMSELLPQGWDILKSAGASLLGGFAGNKLGESLFGKQAESQIGGILGGLAGSLAGPLGAGIGSAIGSLMDVAFGGDGKQRQNAGFLVAPTPGADPSQLFGVEQFASGLNVQGFARRADQEFARSVIEPFRAVDAVVAGLITELEGTLDLTRATLGGYDEEATPGSAGTFFGKGGNGQLAGDMIEQMRWFVQQLLNNVGGVEDEILSAARAAGTAEEAIEILARAVEDKRRADQEATATAEAATAAADKLREAEQQLLAERIGLTSDLSSELTAIRSLRNSLNMDMSTLLGATPLFEIDATVTQQIAHIQEQRQLLLRNYDEAIAAEQRLHEARLASAQGLRDAALSLRLGDSSSLTGQAQLDLIQGEFRQTLQAARGGDTAAADRLRELAQAYAQESQYMFASGEQHQANMAEILSGLDEAAAVMANSDFDPAAAQQQLLVALQDLDNQLMAIAAGVNDSIIDELQNIRVVLEDLTPQMRESLIGAIGTWIDSAGPGGAEIVAALGGIRGSVDALPPEIAGYLSGAMGSWIQQMSASGSYSQVIADGISKGGIDESAANAWLKQQGLGSVNDYRSVTNPDLTNQQIADHVNAVLASGLSEDEAIRRIHADAQANKVGSAQMAAALGMSQQDIIAAAARLGLQSFNGGGIATGPDSGYPVIMHGPEAVVPLDRGAIPVRLDMSAANDAVVRELRGLREDYGRQAVTLEALRKDMRSGMAYAAGQRDELAKLTSQQTSKKEVGNGTIG